jgi:PAS domain S-box-containing protein
MGPNRPPAHPAHPDRAVHGIPLPPGLLDGGGVGILQLTEAAEVAWASPRALELFGATDAAALTREGSPWRAALTDGVRQARESGGAPVSVVLGATAGESLLATAEHGLERGGAGHVTFLLRRAPSPSADESRPSNGDLLTAMLEGCQEALWLVSPKGEILDVNPAAERLSGLRKDAMVGRKLEDLSGGLRFNQDMTREIIARKAAVTFIQTRGDGGKHLIAGQPILGPSGQIRYVVYSLRDASEMSRAVSRLHETVRVAESYRRELREYELRASLGGGIVAGSAAVRAAREAALKYAPVTSPVLLQGETGSGKTVFARLIHDASARRASPFIEINCGAIPESLIEAELFGYAKGAFTGAGPRDKPGLVELADTGTLLLDEVGDLPYGAQVKLLRLLEDGEIRPVGGLRSKRPDVRIIAATNRDLAGMVAQRTFRRDLFYRLNVLTIYIPPLRERPEDLPALVEMMLLRLGDKLGRQRTITAAALAALSRYDFPGNVRELSNILERAVVTADRETIDLVDLPAEVAGLAGAGETWREAVRQLEARLMRGALERYGTQTLAAKSLGVSQATISRKAKLLGLAGGIGSPPDVRRRRPQETGSDRGNPMPAAGSAWHQSVADDPPVSLSANLSYPNR